MSLNYTMSDDASGDGLTDFMKPDAARSDYFHHSFFKCEVNKAIYLGNRKLFPNPQFTE